MPEKFDVNLAVPFAIPETKESLVKFLDHSFDPSGKGLPALTSALQYENKPKFGPSVISNMRFELVAYDADNFKGRIRVRYDMQLTFGCEDAVKDHLDQHSYYNFKFNPAQALLHFESDAFEMPSTANEF